MLSFSPLAPFLRSLRSLTVLVCLAVAVSLGSLASGVSAKPIAHGAKKRGRACKPATRAASAATVASSRRTDARLRASIGRYSDAIAGLRRAGASAHRIEPDQRAIGRLRRQLSCHVRYIVRSGSAGLRVGLNLNSQGWGENAGERQDTVGATGAKWLREEFDWDRIEPRNGEWDFSRYDAVIAAAAQRGMSVLPLLMSAPSWAEPTSDTIPDDPTAYADFVAHVAARYGPGGTFWAEHPDLPAATAPRYLELWNEPYFREFSNGDIDPARYARMVRAAGAAGKQANPNVRFLAAASTVVQPHGATQWVDWVDAMYQAVPNLNRYFDGVAVHPYTKNQAPDAPINGYIHDKFRRITQIHQRFAAHGAADKRLWLTEMGWSTCADKSQCVSEAQQATYTSKLFSMVQGVYRDFVDAVFLYRTSDLAPAGSSEVELNYGLTRQDGRPKPAWTALRAATDAP